MTLRAVTVLAAAAVLAVGCDSGPRSGEIVLDLVSPNADDGALQFVVQSSEVATIESVEPACTGCQVFAEQIGDMEVRGVVVGSIGAGALLRVTVSDVKDRGYVATVTAVAASDFTVRDHSAYSLEVGQR